MVGKKYSETMVRHAAVTAEGQGCEIIERLTFEVVELDDCSWSEPQQVNQRFDLRTGERVNRLPDGGFEVDVEGTPLTLLPA